MLYKLNDELLCMKQKGKKNRAWIVKVDLHNKFFSTRCLKNSFGHFILHISSGFTIPIFIWVWSAVDGGGDSVRHLTHITNSDDLLLTPGRKAELVTKSTGKKDACGPSKKKKRCLVSFPPTPFVFYNRSHCTPT